MPENETDRAVTFVAARLFFFLQGTISRRESKKGLKKG